MHKNIYYRIQSEYSGKSKQSSLGNFLLNNEYLCRKTVYAMR